uniref:Uncharacterized protein n=1 Tax=Rhizophora mucronata TaxID=61149 RepID=A0A2P2K1D9_RHIMU
MGNKAPSIDIRLEFSIGFRSRHCPCGTITNPWFLWSIALGFSCSSLSSRFIISPFSINLLTWGIFWQTRRFTSIRFCCEEFTS